MINPELLTELAIRVMSDFVPPNVHFRGTYLVSHTRKNQDSILKKCRATTLRSRGPVIISNNVDAVTGYSGAPAWRKELRGMGFTDPRILQFDIRGPANTLTEMQNLVAFLRLHRLNPIRLIAWDIHQLRAFITLVSVLPGEYPELRVFNVPGIPLDPHEESRGSQDELLESRLQAYAAEVGRIYRYHAQGDLVDMATVFAYMDRRDRA